MKFLHTSDWHIGKAVRGRSRAAEHEAVLAEIASIADREAVDLVLVVGDLFDSAAPSPESERIAYRALLDLARGGRPVVVVSGNHDNPRRLAAVAPVFASTNVHLRTSIARPGDGGVLALDLGVPVRIALVPFVSQRHIVTVDDLMARDADDHALAYADRLRRVVEVMATGFDPGAVNLIASHAMVAGGVLGGGERSAHTIFEYTIPATAFPVDAHYVALGHLHRTQQLPAPCPVWYCGSPLQMDFSEVDDDKAVLVVTAAPGEPADVTPVPLVSGRRFRTVRGTVAQLAQQVVAGDDAFVRAVVTEPARVGLADEVRALFPDVVDVRVEAPDAPRADDPSALGAESQSPRDQFAAYLEASGVDDPRLLSLFDELLDEAGGAREHADAS